MDEVFHVIKACQNLREDHGEPDVIEIRQTFDDSLQAREWEHKVLRRLHVIKNDMWLNLGTGKAIPPQFGRKHSDEYRNRQKQRMILNNPMKRRILSLETREKISVANKGKTHSLETRERMS